MQMTEAANEVANEATEVETEVETEVKAALRYDLPDASGHFGPYGGVFVAETLMRALAELNESYARYRDDPAFVAEFADELEHYVGRPSPVYHAKRWS